MQLHDYGREPVIFVLIVPLSLVSERMPRTSEFRGHRVPVSTDSRRQNIAGFPYGPKHNVIAA